MRLCLGANKKIYLWRVERGVRGCIVGYSRDLYAR